jgi:hypothetical protein
MSLRILHAQLLRPYLSRPGTPVTRNGDVLIQRIELLHSTAQHSRQRTGLPLRLKSVVVVLHRAALPKHQMPATVHIVQQILCLRIGQQVQRRRHHQLVLAQRHGWRDNVHAMHLRAQRPIVAEQCLLRIERLVVPLPVDRPAAVIRMQQSHVRVRLSSAQRRPCLLELASQPRDLIVQGNRRTVRAYQRPVVLLLTVQRATPLPVRHSIGPMANIVPRHRPHLTLVERIVVLRPVHKARLRLHHPEVLAQKTSRQIVGRAIGHRVQMPRPHIIVPRSNVQVLTHRVVVIGIEEAHHVRRNKLPWIAVLPDLVQLYFLVAAPSIADEPPPAQQQSRVAIGCFNGNLAPVRVGLAPVTRRPSRVQVIQRAIPGLQPRLKL